MEKKPYRKSGLGERGLFPLIFAHAKVAKVGKGGIGFGNAKFGIRNSKKEKGGNPTTLLTRFAGGASSFAKASEDMPKGARGGRGGISNFEIRNAEIGNWRV